MKAIIIGAGIGGLTTALALKQIGIKATIYERASRIQAVGAGLSLWANALRAFDAINIGDAVRSIGVHGHDTAIRAANGRVLSTMATVDLKQRFGDVPLVVVHRAELMDILMNSSHHDIRCGLSFECYEQGENGVTVTFSDGTTDSADILIGADGIHSNVRKQLAPQSTPLYSGYTAWRAVIPFEHKRVQNIWGESWGIGARFGVVPLSDNRVYWFATANRPQGEQLTQAQSKNLLLELFADWHQPVPEVIRETNESLILHNDIFDIDPLESWHDGRVILLGDAVHAMTPNMGQGACQAIEDAIALAKSLTTSTTLEVGISRYASTRQTHTKAIQLQSRRIGQVGQISNATLCWIRNQAMGLMPSSLQVKMLDDVVGYDVTRFI